MKKFASGTLLGILLALSFSSAAIIGGGIFIHNHSGNGSGGGTLNPINLTVSGTLTAPTLSAATSVITPLVSGPAATDLKINAVSGQSGQLQINSSNAFTWASGVFASSNDVTSNLGTAALRWANLFTTNIDSGTSGSLTLRTNNGSGALLTLANTGTFSSGKACATNYTRLTPNYCSLTNVNNNIVIPAVSGCTDISTLLAIPADAKGLDLQLMSDVFTNTGIATRSLDILLSPNSACSPPMAYLRNRAREEVAVAPASLARISGRFIVSNIAGVWVSYNSTGGAGGNVELILTGYFD